MFVDELTITAQAGDGGNGVVRWRQEKFKPKGGPAGGNGGSGGDVFVRAVRDMNRLAKYTGNNHFAAAAGVAGTHQSQHGKNGDSCYIDIPVGSRVSDTDRSRVFELTQVGEVVKILKGGRGGLGNEHFKSSTNVTPLESTEGTEGESGTFLIEVALSVDVGLIGYPNAGKSTLLNLLTNAQSKVGSYPFTTIEPHLGDFYGYVLADIPGLITGAAEGKGLGHKFLKHVSRTKMLLHLVSLENSDVVDAYYAIRSELANATESLSDKEEWVILTKKDIVKQTHVEDQLYAIEKINNRVFVISENDQDSVAVLQTALVQHLQESYNSNTK